jgi:2-oxoglutarate ferredoxin oxidoreductase subunit beta
LFVDPEAASFAQALSLSDEPLATLPQARVRPSPAALQEIIESLR